MGAFRYPSLQAYLSHGDSIGFSLSFDIRVRYDAHKCLYMSIYDHGKEHFLSDTADLCMCENAHMSKQNIQDELRDRQKAWIERIKQATGKSYTEIARESGCAASTVYRFMGGQSDHCLSAATEAKIKARFGDNPEKIDAAIPVPMSAIPVVGIVQAGLWQAEYARPFAMADEFVSVGPDPRYAGLQRSAFKVLGDSMNLLYPPGTTVIAVSFYDLGRGPKTGEKVIVVRKVDGYEEATIKEIEILADGRVALWPRSTNPEYSQALILPVNSFSDDFPDNGCHPEYRIVGLVTQSIKLE